MEEEFSSKYNIEGKPSGMPLEEWLWITKQHTHKSYTEEDIDNGRNFLQDKKEMPEMW